jgi:hypothetical protein
MESIKRLSDVDPSDLAVVERVFGQRIESTRDLVLILKTADAPLAANDRAVATEDGDVPIWCDVLEGMSEDELTEFAATLEMPVRMARSTHVDGS